MKVIRKGSTGQQVEDWQNFLIGRGFSPGIADGKFGDATKAATMAFQANHGLVSDGVVGNRTFGQAMILGFEGADDPPADRANPDTSGPHWPPEPNLRPIIGTKGRQKAFGKFAFRAAPTESNPERIKITDNWAKKNITKVHMPQLAGVPGAPSSGKIVFFKPAHAQLQAMWQAWEDDGLIDRVLSWAGSFSPRFIRGSRTALSNHAFGTAFDINVFANGLGAVPALVGKRGSVRELVPIANEHGFYWGGHFRRRKDGMHFEVAKLK